MSDDTDLANVVRSVAGLSEAVSHLQGQLLAHQLLWVRLVAQLPRSQVAGFMDPIHAVLRDLDHEIPPRYQLGEVVSALVFEAAEAELRQIREKLAPLPAGKTD